MSVYQKIVELQDEIEQLTGVRPDIDVHFHTRFFGLNEQQSKDIRDLFVGCSDGEMSQMDVPLEIEGERKWFCYKGEDNRGIEVNVHGPAVQYEPVS